MAGLQAPLSTLRLAPRGALRMTRGQSGLLFLLCLRLSLFTLCRSPGAHRGRDIHCWMPPAQIPAGVIHAPGSHLGWLTTNPTSSFAYTIKPLGHPFPARGPPRVLLSPVPLGPLPLLPPLPPPPPRFFP